VKEDTGKKEKRTDEERLKMCKRSFKSGENSTDAFEISSYFFLPATH